MTRLRKAGLGLGVAAALLLLLNLAVLGWEYRQNGTVRWGGRPLGVYDEAGRLQPGTEIRGAAHRFRVNGAGLRGGELSPSKAANTVRIWCAGGSTTFDTGVSDDAHTWPAQLEAVLRAAHPELDLQVVNAGLPGEVMKTNLEDFRQLAPTFRPDLLLVYHGPNDVGHAASARYGMEMGPQAVSSDFPLYRLLVQLLPPAAAPAGWADHRVERADLAGLVRDTEALVAAARGSGAAVVLSSHALAAAPDATGWDARRRLGREARPGKLSGEAYIQAIDLANALFAEIAAREDLPFADIRAAVPPSSAWFVDGMHFSDRGARRAAEAFAATLEAADLVKPRVAGVAGPGGPTSPPGGPAPAAPAAAQGPPLPPQGPPLR